MHTAKTTTHTFSLSSCLTLSAAPAAGAPPAAGFRRAAAASTRPKPTAPTPAAAAIHPPDLCGHLSADMTGSAQNTGPNLPHHSEQNRVWEIFCLVVAAAFSHGPFDAPADPWRQWHHGAGISTTSTVRSQRIGPSDVLQVRPHRREAATTCSAAGGFCCCEFVGGRFG